MIRWLLLPPLRAYVGWWVRTMKGPPGDNVNWRQVVLDLRDRHDRWVCRSNRFCKASFKYPWTDDDDVPYPEDWTERVHNAQLYSRRSYRRHMCWRHRVWAVVKR